MDDKISNMIGFWIQFEFSIFHTIAEHGQWMIIPHHIRAECFFDGIADAVAIQATDVLIFGEIIFIVPGGKLIVEGLKINKSGDQNE